VPDGRSVVRSLTIGLVVLSLTACAQRTDDQAATTTTTTTADPFDVDQLRSLEREDGPIGVAASAITGVTVIDAGWISIDTDIYRDAEGRRYAQALCVAVVTTPEFGVDTVQVLGSDGGVAASGRLGAIPICE
jgi:hypothetical protein